MAYLLGAFEDPDIIHVDDIVDPVRDLEVITEELRLKVYISYLCTIAHLHWSFLYKKLAMLKVVNARAKGHALRTSALPGCAFLGASNPPCNGP